MLKFDFTKYGSTPRLAVLTVILLTAIVFLPSLFNGFVDWDDHIYVFENDYIKALSPTNIKAFFTREFAATYCPLPMISYALEHALFGLDPFIYHLTNYSLHIVVTALVFFFIYSISHSVGAAFMAALLFGVHPLHVESVAWVSERKDLLAALFYMLTLISYRRYLDDKKTTALYLAFLFMALSLLSKAMAVTIPPVLFLMDYLHSRRMNARAFFEKLPFMALSVIFGALTFYFQSSKGATALKADIAFKIYFISKSILFYLSKIFFPINLSAIYPYHDINLRHLAMIKFNIAAIAVLAVLMIIAARRSRKIAFALSFSVISILPVLKIVPIGDVFAADRYMYLPSVGIFYLIAIAAAKILSGKKEWTRPMKIAAIMALSGWMIWFSALSWQRCRVWKDTESLFSDVLKKYPHVPLANNEVGRVYMKRGEFEKAVPYFKKAIHQTNRPDVSDSAKRNLELSYEQMKEAPRKASGVPRAQGEGASGRDEAITFNNLGVEQGRAGNLDNAIELFKRAIELDPAFPEPYNNIGYTYRKKGDPETAVKYYKKALEADPEYEQARRNLGTITEQLEKKEKVKQV